MRTSNFDVGKDVLQVNKQGELLDKTYLKYGNS